MRRRRRSRARSLGAAAVALAVTIALSACSSGERAATGDGWTVLHYSMADTDLEEFMVADLNEMAEIGSGGGLQLRAFVDRSPDYSEADALGLGDWVGAKVLDIGDAESEVVNDLGDVNSASADTLAEFIASGIAAHPAAHYALIISDHGASWPGIGPDETSDYDVLDLEELTKGIDDGLEKAGVDKLDLLGFDACLMASYEVASAVAPLADRLVASQELEPGHGWDYRSLEVLAEDPQASADEFGEALAEGFVAQAEEAGTDAGITLSLLDLTKMDDVDNAVDDFAGALEESVDSVAPVVGRANSSTLGFARSPDETEDAHLRDLGQLAATIGADADGVAAEAETLVDAIDAAVVELVTGAATEGATGLSIYFPPVAELTAEGYAEIGGADAWRGFLTAFHEAGESIPKRELPDFVSDEGAEVALDEDGAVISGAFEEAGADNLVEAIVSYAVVNDDGTLTYFGEEYAALADDGSPRAEGVYDLTALTITDGEDTAYAYLSLFETDDEDVFTVDVPMAYYAPGEEEEYDDVLLTLSIDGESGDMLDQTYYVYDEDSGTYGELDADPEGIVVPEVLVIDAEGEEVWEPTSDVGLFADLETLEFELEPLASGTRLQLDLTVIDYGDNSDTISAQLTVP
ncbi:MAG TPA: clostripain-related cysteine peptidase [Acidimicrobiales bacterium]|nr:clostripain-related cysteine peptidase [Acidimicrobiales bacterium]